MVEVVASVRPADQLAPDDCGVGVDGRMTGGLQAEVGFRNTAWMNVH